MKSQKRNRKTENRKSRLAVGGGTFTRVCLGVSYQRARNGKNCCNGKN